VTDLLAPLLALPGVEPAVAGARSAIDGLLSHRVLRRGSAEVTAESALRGARASAELEGAGIELERLRGQLMAGTAVVLPGSSAGAGERGARLVQGAVRLHADLGQLLVAWRHSPRQALARLHVLAAAELVDESDALGRPRSSGVEPDDPLGLGRAPDPLEVAARLDGLARVLTAGTSAPAVVAAAVVHGELMALRPFGTATGWSPGPPRGSCWSTAASTPRRCPRRRWATPSCTRVREALHGYVSGGPQGVAAWIVHCAQAVELGAREGLAVCEAIRRGRADARGPRTSLELGTAALRGGPPSPCVGGR
jgi:hypothetical protein